MEEELDDAVGFVQEKGPKLGKMNIELCRWHRGEDGEKTTPHMERAASGNGLESEEPVHMNTLGTAST